MSILKKTARWPRNARCHCGSGKKYKYCCRAQSSEQPILSSKRTNYIDTGESAVRYVISDAGYQLLLFERRQDLGVCV